MTRLPDLFLSVVFTLGHKSEWRFVVGCFEFKDGGTRESHECNQSVLLLIWPLLLKNVPGCSG